MINEKVSVLLPTGERKLGTVSGETETEYIITLDNGEVIKEGKYVEVPSEEGTVNGKVIGINEDSTFTVLIHCNDKIINCKEVHPKKEPPLEPTNYYIFLDTGEIVKGTIVQRGCGKCVININILIEEDRILNDLSSYKEVCKRYMDLSKSIFKYTREDFKSIAERILPYFPQQTEEDIIKCLEQYESR